MADRPLPTITADRFDAVLFDLDGVLTDTASLHARAWKQMFDEFLHARAERERGEYVPFDIDADYARYVDGKPRYDGVRDFLASREISLPWGDSSDPPTAVTVCGLGNRKNELVLALLEAETPDIFDDGVALLKGVRAAGIKTAVVSSSKNCEAVIKAVGIDHDFDAKVDGVVGERMNLEGKPAPDTYLEAARELGVEASRAVVVEDALSGVESGRAGRFGLVVGVDRKGDPQALVDHGADVATSDLRKLLP